MTLEEKKEHTVIFIQKKEWKMDKLHLINRLNSTATKFDKGIGMKLDIESFKVLDLIVETGSFSRAAEKLNKAQSAISYQIKKLEKQLGTSIFDRKHYRAKLTPAGRVILNEGRRLLNQVKYIAQLADRYAEGWEPSMEVVIDGALPMDPVMKTLKILTEREVPTKIKLKVEFLSGVQQRFVEDDADLMLVKDFIASPGLVAEALPQIENILVTSPEHPLSLEKNITRDRLQQFVELTVNDSAGIGSKYQDAHQFGGDRVFYLSGFIYKKHALLMGLGFGWMPEFLIKNELDSGALVKVDYNGGSQYQFTPRLVSTDYRPLGKAAELFKRLVVEEYHKTSTRVAFNG